MNKQDAMKTTKRKWIAAGLIAAGAFFTGLQVQAAQIAYWSFDDPNNLGKDSIGSHDLSAYSTYNLPVYDANGKFDGGASRFDNSSSWETPTYIFPEGSFTFTAFAKPDDTNITTLVTSRNRVGGFDIIASGGKWVVKTYNDAKKTETVYGPDGSVTTDWTHIAATFAPSTGPDADGSYTGMLRLYLNGVQVVSHATSVYYDGSTSMRIGTSWPVFSEYRGLMDEIQLYDTVLSAEEIFEMANPPVVALYILSN